MSVRKLLSSAAIALALTAGVAIVAPGSFITPAAAHKDKAPKLSREVSKPLSEAQKLLGEGKLDEAAAKVDEAAAIKDLKPYDSFVVSQFKLQIAAKKNDYNAAAAAYEQMLPTEFMPTDMRRSAYRLVIQVSNQNKDYDKAATMADKYLAEFGDDPDILILGGQARYFGGHYAEASTEIQKAIKLQQSKGAKIDKSWYDLWVSADLKAGGGQNAAARNAIIGRLENYPNKQDWLVLIDLAQRSHKNFSDNEFAEVYRINWLTDTLDPREYASGGRLLIQVKLYGDAVKLLQKGVDAGYVTGADAKLLPQAKAAMEKDKAIIDKIAAAAKTSPNGIGLLNVSKAYRNYDEPEKAVEFAKAAIAKGGLKSVEDAKLQLAIAEMAAGDNAAAQTDFDALAQTGTAAGAIAGVYTVYNKMHTPAAAPAAADASAATETPAQNEAAAQPQ